MFSTVNQLYIYINQVFSFIICKHPFWFPTLGPFCSSGYFSVFLAGPFAWPALQACFSGRSSRLSALLLMLAFTAPGLKESLWDGQWPSLCWLPSMYFQPKPLSQAPLRRLTGTSNLARPGGPYLPPPIPVTCTCCPLSWHRDGPAFPPSSTPSKHLPDAHFFMREFHRAQILFTWAYQQTLFL